jgi:DNA-binding SARP family transcriptional activator
MQFRILGELQAEAGGEPLPLRGRCERKLLAILLLDVGRVVPLSRLVDALWEDAPPATAAKQARNAVSRLRRLLDDSGAAGLIETVGVGYRAAVQQDALDAWLFEAAARAAELAAAAGRLAEAVRLCRSALDLWRGPFLDGMTGRVIESTAAGWNERRCTVTETYFDLQLALGHHREAVAGLIDFVAAQPLREKAVGQLMLALYRCGRRAEALAIYRRTHALLSTELGLDPGAELRLLHQRILTGDPALAAQPPAARQGGEHSGRCRLRRLGRCRGRPGTSPPGEPG